MLRDEIARLLMSGMTGWGNNSNGEYFISVDADKTAEAIMRLVEPDEEKMKHTIKSNVGGYPCEISSWQVSQIVTKIMQAWRAGRLKKESGKEKA